MLILSVGIPRIQGGESLGFSENSYLGLTCPPKTYQQVMLKK